MLPFGVGARRVRLRTRKWGRVRESGRWSDDGRCGRRVERDCGDGCVVAAAAVRTAPAHTAAAAAAAAVRPKALRNDGT
eukprot:3258985-Prymnesium_polylepis.2